jgi:hypothetical protein
LSGFGVSSRVESSRVESDGPERAGDKNRAEQNRAEQNKKNRSKRFGTCGLLSPYKGTVACLVLGVRGSGNEHAAAHAKERGVGSLLGDEMQEARQERQANTYVPSRRGHGHGIPSSSGSERTERTEALALPRRRRRRRLRVVAQAPLRRSSHVLYFRGRNSRVPTTVPRPRESVHITSCTYFGTIVGGYLLYQYTAPSIKPTAAPLLGNNQIQSARPNGQHAAQYTKPQTPAQQPIAPSALSPSPTLPRMPPPL